MQNEFNSTNFSIEHERSTLRRNVSDAHEMLSVASFNDELRSGLGEFDRAFRSEQPGDVLSQLTEPTPGEELGNAPQPDSKARGRAWCFTWNNYLEETYQALKDNGSGGGLKYIIVAREQAPTTGTRHLQGYCYFSNFKSLRQVKSWLCSFGPGSPRLVLAAGTAAQNKTYCSKDGDFFEAGTMPEHGKRTDLEMVYEDVKKGKPIVDIIDNNAEAFIKYAKNLLLINNLINYQTHRNIRPYVLWFTGPTGSGKSRDALRLAKHLGTYYYKNPTNKWWDGYQQQACIVIDDYRRDFCTFADLLRLLDWYPFTLEVKGGTVALNSSVIIFTSPKTPVDTWEGRSQEDFNQLTRRIDHVVQFPLLFPLDCETYTQEANALKETIT